MRKWLCRAVTLVALAAGLAFTQTSFACMTGPGYGEIHGNRIDIIAGQDVENPIGIVRLGNGAERVSADYYRDIFKLQAELDSASGWQVAEWQLHVGDCARASDCDSAIPTTKKGNPIPGKFAYKGVGPVTVKLPLAALDFDDTDMEFNWGRDNRHKVLALHMDLVKLDAKGKIVDEEGAWARVYKKEQDPDSAGCTFDGSQWGWYLRFDLAHAKSGQLIDAPVEGVNFESFTHDGVTGENGGYRFFPGQSMSFSIGSVQLGEVSSLSQKTSPLDFFPGGDLELTGDDYDENGYVTNPVINLARLLQSLDTALAEKKIVITPTVASCLEAAVSELQLAESGINFNDGSMVEDVINETYVQCVDLAADLELAYVDAIGAQGNLEAGLNASGIFRKNLSKTEDFGESKQKLEVMPVYFPGMRSDDTPSYCGDTNGDGLVGEGDDLGVPYEEWRLNGDPLAEECDPRLYEDGSCVVTLIECREVAKPIISTYREVIDIYDDQVTTGFWPGRFSTDIVTAVSRDDGTTWKRRNVSRMADLSSFELETGEPFPGTAGSPYLKVNDNYILNVWQSKFCKSGNPRYAIDNCDLYPDDCVDADNDGLVDDVCRGNADNDTLVCEEDYKPDDAYYVTDIWGVRGHQQSVDYNEVDDVAELGIGEIPYSCLWAARGVIVSQRELDAGTFDSLTVTDDNGTPDDTSDDVIKAVGLGDIVWYKPERLTSGRRDAYIPVAGSARGAGFAIAWQEDPSGLRPGKGKGPGQGWSGAISNHKTDIWYSYLRYEDFAAVDTDFVPGGPPESEGPDEKPGVGRPKALVPFSLPVRISDNDMVNTDTLKVEQSGTCVTPPGGTESVCFPEVVENSFVPLDPEEIASQFCGHPDADPVTCCDPDNHEGDPNCEDLKGLYGNMTGTKRYAYLAKTIDNDGDGMPDYQYYVDQGGTLDLCDTSGTNTYMDVLPGTSARERWYGFTNVAEASKLVCVTSDGRLLDGDVSASRPNMQIQPYTKPDGTKSAWVLLGYEESKGMGHSLAAESHDDSDNPVDEIIGVKPEDPGQDKGFKQDIGKNVIYHSFDFTQPDLVSPGHIVNLPALCGGLYPNYCGDDYDGTNPTCTCMPGEPVPLYFDYYIDNGDGTGEWMPDETKFLQYRTEIARRVRFIMQSPGKMGSSKTLGAIIYKQGQEGQGRPADVFIRRMVKSGIGNPYKFENFECSTYLDETFALPACANGAGDKPSAVGYMCNVWGEATGDRLCGGVFTDPNGGYPRRDHVNLTSADIDLSVDAGPEDDTPDDPTDDIYGTDKVLLWSQHDYNLGDESYGVADTSICDLVSCAGMYSNARSHRGFIRGDFLVTAYAFSPNWAAGRNGRDRYNFYTRRSFDGGETWTTTPADLGGVGVNFCREWRSDPTIPDEDGSGNAPPVYEGFDPECVDWCPPCPEGETCDCTVTGEAIAAGAFEPARKVSEFDNNKETSSDPRVGATPPTYPLDGRDGAMPVLRFVEDEYLDNVFFVAWGGGDNLKSTGGTAVTPEAPPTDIWYTRSEDYGDHYLKIPWVIGGENSNQGYGETVWRYDFLAKGDEEEQGECQLRATSDGSKMYSIYHEMVAAPEDPDAEITRWYPWEPEESSLNDLWFRRVIFWPDEVTTP